MTVLRMASPADDIAEVLIDEQAIAAKVRELGTAIADDYRGKDVVLVSILKGALPFLADLMRQMPIPLALDFLEVSSYGEATESSGVVRILKDLAKPIEGRHVVVVEDILHEAPAVDHRAFIARHLNIVNSAALEILPMPTAPAPTDWPTLASLMRIERERRKEAGEPYGTLADVSEAAKVTIAAVANWETGVDFPTRENFVRWVTILDRRQWIALYDDLAATEAMLRSGRRHRQMSKEDEARIRAAMSRGKK